MEETCDVQEGSQQRPRSKCKVRPADRGATPILVKRQAQDWFTSNPEGGATVSFAEMHRKVKQCPEQRSATFIDDDGLAVEALDVLLNLRQFCLVLFLPLDLSDGVELREMGAGLVVRVDFF